MSTSKELQKIYEDLEADAQKLMAEKDAAFEKLRKRYTDKLRKANDKAAEAQKDWLNREAVEELLSRDDQAEAKRIAETLGLATNEFPEED